MAILLRPRDAWAMDALSAHVREAWSLARAIKATSICHDSYILFWFHTGIC